MNRQVIPSMILSVLIVCFFSVMLYEREQPQASAYRCQSRDGGHVCVGIAEPGKIGRG